MLVAMGAAKRWAAPVHERGGLLVDLRRGLRRLIRLCTIDEVVLGEETGHGLQSGFEALILEGILLLGPEDGRRLVDDVGHRHGYPLLTASKDPL
jgi:hypothetical protein